MKRFQRCIEYFFDRDWTLVELNNANKFLVLDLNNDFCAILDKEIIEMIEKDVVSNNECSLKELIMFVESSAISK